MERKRREKMGCCRLVTRMVSLEGGQRSSASSISVELSFCFLDEGSGDGAEEMVEWELRGDEGADRLPREEVESDPSCSCVDVS